MMIFEKWCFLTGPSDTVSYNGASLDPLKTIITFAALFSNACSAEITLHYTALNTSENNLKMHVCV